MAQHENCSRCEKALDTAGYPKWCKACRASYKREYESLRTQMGEGRGFAAGVTAMRRLICEELDKIAFSSFECREIRDIVAAMPGPKLPE
jgi:predicted amidophosphoribosyltransferase